MTKQETVYCYAYVDEMGNAWLDDPWNATGYGPFRRVFVPKEKVKTDGTPPLAGLAIVKGRWSELRTRGL